MGAFVCAFGIKINNFFKKFKKKKVLIKFLMLFVCTLKKKVEVENN